MDFGYYDTVKDLIDAVNKTLLGAVANNSIHLAFNPRTAKVKVYIKKKHGLAFFDKSSRMLGFGEDTKLFKTTESPFVADLFGIRAIYVYCDIVQPHIFGNTNVIYFEPFLLAESRVMSLRKHLLTFSTCPCKQSLSKTPKFF